MSGIPNFGMRSAQGIAGANMPNSAKINNDETVSTTGVQEGVKADNSQDGTTVLKKKRVGTDGNGTVVVLSDDGKGHVIEICDLDGNVLTVLDYDKGEKDGCSGYSGDELDAYQGRYGIYPPL